MVFATNVCTCTPTCWKNYQLIYLIIFGLNNCLIYTLISAKFIYKANQINKASHLVLKYAYPYKTPLSGSTVFRLALRWREYSVTQWLPWIIIYYYVYLLLIWTSIWSGIEIGSLTIPSKNTQTLQCTQVSIITGHREWQRRDNKVSICSLMQQLKMRVLFHSVKWLRMKIQDMAVFL